MYLENEYIQLRALEPEDLDLLYKWENDSSLWLHGNTLSPYSRLAIRQYIANAQDADIYQARQLRLMVVLKEKKLIIGTIDLYDFEPRHNRVGVGILIDKEFRQQDYASQVLKLIEEYAFGFLHLHQLYAHIAVKNEKSLNLFKKMGYVVTGTLNDWLSEENKYEAVFVLQLINN